MNIVAIVGGLLIALVVILLPVILILGLVKILTGASKSKELSVEEAKLMQEIYRGLTRMEKRIESLETILVEKEGKGSENDKVYPH